VGIVLSGGNPGFLFWWGTAGLLIANALWQQGWLAVGLFAVIHWLCDLVWLEALSLATFKGTRLLGARWHKAVLGGIFVVYVRTRRGSFVNFVVQRRPKRIITRTV
jgi:threonine/homoserine/homoserine lactone efflux protein